MILRLGINIDHVATVRNARGGDHPCPVRAAQIAAEAGADGITAHLREDRRHIKDADIERLKKEISLPLNLEMAATPEMLAIALKVKPHAVCLVPEKREELTTEGGLDVIKLEKQLTPLVKQLQDNGSRVSLFIAPYQAQIEAALRTGARAVELHTGTYAESVIKNGFDSKETRKQASFVFFSAEFASAEGLEVHAGHGLTYDNVGPIAAIAHIKELNIGHFLIGEAIFTGLKDAIKTMRTAMDDARKNMIIGIGSDLSDIRRIEQTLKHFGERFENRVFTEQERMKARGRKKAGDKILAGTYAKRFAAKEACSKALGTGMRAGIAWRDIEVTNLPSGEPTITLHGKALKRLIELTPKGHTARIHLTMTDEYPIAQAFVIISAEK